MELIFQDFGDAQTEQDGYLLARSLTPELTNDVLVLIWRSCNAHDARHLIRRGIGGVGNQGFRRLSSEEVQGWVEVYYAYWRAVGEILAVRESSSENARSSQASWGQVYESWKELLSQLVRGYNTHGFPAWTIPCLYVVTKHLRTFAIKADAERNSNGDTVRNAAPGTNFDDDFDPEAQKNQCLEECARQLNKVFILCLSDRAPLEESRKWGIYYIANLLFKTYFKLNSTSLCTNILKALSAGRGDMPELSSFPKSQQVTFKYYEGVLAFLDENYISAEKHLTEAWKLCHKDAKKNQELILTYLIPCHLLTTHTLPSHDLLAPFPRLQRLFLALSDAIKRGHLHKFDQALQEGEDEFVKRRIYLTLERGRDIALRNLLRKVFIAGGFEEPKAAGEIAGRRTRVPIAEFAAAISLGSKETLDNDEIECFLANMIYKNLMKGYIARDRGFVVLSKSGAFPGTGV